MSHFIIEAIKMRMSVSVLENYVELLAGRLSFTSEQIRTVLNSMLNLFSNDNQCIYTSIFYREYFRRVCETVEMRREDILTIMTNFFETLNYYYCNCAFRSNNVHNNPPASTCPYGPHNFMIVNRDDVRCTICGVEYSNPMYG